MFHTFNNLLPFLFILLVKVLPSETYKADHQDAWKNHQQEEFILGAIIDHTTRAGKEEEVAIQLAVDDFFANFGRRRTLLVNNSRGDPVLAATAAKSLVKNYHARVVVGLGTWQEASFVADLANNFKVPFVSWANDVPSWASSHSPFLVYTARSQFAQMKAVAAIIRSWRWTQVNLLCEDDNLACSSMIPYLVDALKDMETEINELVPLSPLPQSDPLSKKLKNLKDGKCRVFIVHTSVKLATNIFQEAKKLGMMEKDYVWLTTNSITNVIDTLNVSIINSMQGVLGVRSYFSRSGKQFEHFRSRFQAVFHRQYPEETHLEPGISACQAYDVVRAVALPMRGNFDRKPFRNSNDQFVEHMVSLSGKKLLKRILKSNFEGFTGEFQLKRGTLAPAHVYSIVNVFGTLSKELGYWTEGLGFSLRTDGSSPYNESMRILKQVRWPGGSCSVPSGLKTEESVKRRLRIGVPTGKSHIEFVNVSLDHRGGVVNATGFSIEVFKIIADKHLPGFDLHPFSGTYTSMVKQVFLEKFDAVVGDTAIIANRSKYAEFSQPFAEPGVRMVVLPKPRMSGGAWLFQKPFTPGMWATTGAIVLYNGFVVWLIERKNHPEFTTGTKFNQFGSMVFLAFTALFSLHGEKLHSNLSRMTMVVWLFMALIITQSYTASLTTLLTNQRLEPTIPDVQTLQRNGEKVGCDGDSFVVQYLQDVLHFDPTNIIKIYSEEEYNHSLSNGIIAAAFLEVPYVKVFLAKYCYKFTAGPITYPVGGFGFAFPRNSPYLPYVSQEILQLSEDGKLRELEESFNISSNCTSDSENDKDHESLALLSFEGLFYVTIATSTVSLILFITPYLIQKQRFWLSNVLPEPSNIHEVADEDLVSEEYHADHEQAMPQQPPTHEHWLSAWEMENQFGRRP